MKILVGAIEDPCCFRTFGHSQLSKTCHRNVQLHNPPIVLYTIHCLTYCRISPNILADTCPEVTMITWLIFLTPYIWKWSLGVNHDSLLPSKKLTLTIQIYIKRFFMIFLGECDTAEFIPMNEIFAILKIIKINSY